MRLFIAMALCAASAAGAQVSDLMPGSRLRIESSVAPRRVEGTLMAHEGPNMVVASSGALRMTVPYQTVTRVRVSLGKSRGAGAVRGAKIGASIGGVFALIVGWALVSSETGAQPSGLLPFVVTNAAGGAIWGLGIGAAVGSEKWTTVYQSPLKSAETR